MRKIKFICTAFLFIALCISVSSFTLAPANKKLSAGNAHVNGGGTAIEGGEVSTFVFNAVEGPDGITHGHLNYHFRAGDASIKVDINCMSINGNRATLGGVVTSLSIATTPPVWMFVGQNVSFSVEDNGQGKNIDKISDLIFGGGTSCSDNWSTYIAIKGNIDIKE